MARATLAELARELAAKRLSSVELTRACLERIERHNARLNAFITVDPDKSLAAGARGRRAARGRQRAIRSPASRSRTRTSSAPRAGAPPAARACSPTSSPPTTRT